MKKKNENNFIFVCGINFKKKKRYQIILFILQVSRMYRHTTAVPIHRLSNYIHTEI